MAGEREKSELPSGWCWATVGEVIDELKNGISTTPDAVAGTPVLRISAVRPGTVDLSDVRFLNADADVSAYLLQPNDLLFTRYNGNPALVGACGRVGEVRGQLVYPDKLIRVRVDRSIVLPEWIEFAARSTATRAHIDEHSKSAAGQVGISGADLKAAPIVVPPLAEQRRIVAKLEELLGRIRRARAALDAVPAMVERYKKSVLGVEFQLSSRLVPLGDLFASFRSGTGDVPKDTPTQWRMLRSSSVRPGQIDWTDCRFLQSPPADADRLAVDDLLITRLSGSLEFVGNCARVTLPSANEFAFPDRLFRARCGPRVDPGFVELYFQHQNARAAFALSSKSTAGHQRISMSTVSSLPIPLPPLDEQRAIVARIDAAFARARALLTAADTARAQLDALERSVLAKAFRGELVPQDPSDEPASALLERVRAVRAERAAPKRAKKAKRASA